MFKIGFNIKKTSTGFTLIELLVVIMLLGALTTILMGNFFTSLKKGRDARRKSDLENIQKALEMYYEDNKTYPASISFGSSLSSSTKTYMQKIPNDPVAGNNYLYESDGTYYRLFSCIENKLDESPGVSQTGYVGTPGICGTGDCATCKYTVSDSGSNLLTPVP